MSPQLKAALLASPVVLVALGYAATWFVPTTAGVKGEGTAPLGFVITILAVMAVLGFALVVGFAVGTFLVAQRIYLHSLDRTTARKGQIATRTALTDRVKELNRAEAEAVTVSGRKWSGFVERLAEAVESTPAAHVLDEVLLSDGQMSVRQWLAARRSKASTTEENR